MNNMTYEPEHVFESLYEVSLHLINLPEYIKPHIIEIFSSIFEAYDLNNTDWKCLKDFEFSGFDFHNREFYRLERYGEDKDHLRVLWVQCLDEPETRDSPASTEEKPVEYFYFDLNDDQDLNSAIEFMKILTGNMKEEK